MVTLRVILLMLHLVSMNVASVGPLLCLWLRWCGRQGHDSAEEAGKRLERWSLVALIAGVVVGFIQFGLIWLSRDEAYLEALARFPQTALASVVGEAAFSAACLAIYAKTWQLWRGRPWLHGIWALLAATNLLYHFPPLMVGIRQLAARPELVLDPVVDRGSFRPLILRPEILSQSIHFVLASVAVTGVLLMWIAGRNDSHVVRSGARLALLATMAQIVVGGWVLLTLPIGIRNDLTGDQWLATSLFLLALAASLALLHALAMASLGETDTKMVRRCGALLMTVIFLMTCVLWLTNMTQSLA